MIVGILNALLIEAVVASGIVALVTGSLLYWLVIAALVLGCLVLAKWLLK